METRPPDVPTTLLPTSPRMAEVDRLGDQIAELSAHLEAATARLLALIREFDARGGWNIANCLKRDRQVKTWVLAFTRLHLGLSG